MFVPRCLRSCASSSSSSAQRPVRASEPVPSSDPASPSCPQERKFLSSPAAPISDLLPVVTTAEAASVSLTTCPSSSSQQAAAHLFAIPKSPSSESTAGATLHLSSRSSSRAVSKSAGTSLFIDQSLTTSTGALGVAEDTDDSIVVRSIDQRVAKPDEPSCVVCGRYGEYICDETDEDVCSLECKAAALRRLALGVGNPGTQVPVFSASDASAPILNTADNLRVVHPIGAVSQNTLPSMQDECIIVRDGEQKLPVWEPEAVVKRLTDQQVDALRKQIDVAVRGDDVPKPILEFSNCKLMPKLQDNLEISGFESPTPVQMQLIPGALKGRDLLVCAGTGSGKTVGYLLSVVFRCCLIRTHFQPERQKPLAIVLTPTRELCVQVEDQAKALAKGLPLKTALVVGGDALPQQLHRLKQGVELVVGTPGRLIDLLTKHEVDLDDVCMVVLDEVDCMLERGFRDQVMQIMTALTQPQVMMFSATIPPFIEKFSTSILRRPLHISVGKSSSPSEAVKQTVIWVETKNKKKKLFDILTSPHHFRPPVVVFVNSRKGAELLAGCIKAETGLEAAAVHGEKPMQERREVLKAFLMGTLPIVVATGVLGRGLDLLRVTQVIVFDMPHSVEEYIHQIGRASRLGVPGSAMVFINDESKVLFKNLIELFRSSGIVIPKELSSSPYVASSYAAAYNPKRRKVYRKTK